MKTKSLFLLIPLLLSGCDQTVVKEIGIEELSENLNNPEYIIIDTRPDSLYFGFKDKGAARGGHIKGAMQFTTGWLDFIDENKFDTFVEEKGISKEKTLVFYDSDPDSLERITAEFAAKGFQVRAFKSFIQYSNSDLPMDKYPNYFLSVSPAWLQAALNGEKPESYTSDQKPVIFEVSWGDAEQSKSYATHIKGAFHFNTDWIENAPVWNLSEPDVIKNNLLKNGIRKDTPVVVYSENQMAALRVLWALKWAGVEDVRFLNGGLNVWTDAELPTETTLNIPVPVADFGAEIPVNPQVTIAMPAEAIQGQKSGLKLISNRTWDEHTGKISGYDYIPRKGEPAGAIWGFGGKNSNDMSDYYDPDGTLRNPEEIFALWKTQGIEPTDQVAFYCGTGWRASVSWFMTQLAGWENSRIYDGGWNAWQMDPTLPVLNNIQSQKPAALNDYGEIIKKPGQSCKS
ncbi:rhodanese-like domain-containing protein [Morganella morganii]|uniref:rhodanese-like domain-containing protein n=1 Tax=Morganella morganii TaxID=582 RepID=UPI001BD9802D|nr:rhodanese-like domain-containing protein [Morganella morganii]ELA8730675.1 sulfurtransferase [Morganella morganii]ELB1850047.1 sulfurtransferase [Morganella morganii]MBT0489122.1 sulfurtransferase [Morganella morganii subsp. morganii]QWM06292.1 sulfurtransferase [Morganella morganii subsp. morganii]